MKGLYKHYKGSVYEVVGVAKHSETLNDLIIYRLVGSEVLWARPINMWNEGIMSNGILVPRFQKLEEQNEPTRAAGGESTGGEAGVD